MESEEWQEKPPSGLVLTPWLPQAICSSIPAGVLLFSLEFSASLHFLFNTSFIYRVENFPKLLG